MLLYITYVNAPQNQEKLHQLTMDLKHKLQMKIQKQMDLKLDVHLVTTR